MMCSLWLAPVWIVGSNATPSAICARESDSSITVTSSSPSPSTLSSAIFFSTRLPIRFSTSVAVWPTVISIQVPVRGFWSLNTPTSRSRAIAS